MKRVTLDVCFEEDRQLNKFFNMLAWMEYCGRIGHTTDFFVRLDGDGSARPKFLFPDPKLQESYDELVKSMANTYKKSPLPSEKVQVDVHVCID